jgi:transposase InsO family protein
VHASFVRDALEQALHDRRPVHGGGLVHHSDRGSQGGFKYTERLAVAGVEPSVGRVGGSYDNVLAETISDYTRPRSFTGARRGAFEATEFATLEWVDWFNDSSVTQTKRPLRRQIR